MDHRDEVVCRLGSYIPELSGRLWQSFKPTDPAETDGCIFNGFKTGGQVNCR
jgi:hypothetical protein